MSFIGIRVHELTKEVIVLKQLPVLCHRVRVLELDHVRTTDRFPIVSPTGQIS